MAKMMRVVACDPGQPARVEWIGTELEDLQAEVGGYIEPVRGRFPDQSVLILADEEGLLKERSQNRLGLVGTFIVLREDGSKFVGLSQQEAEEIVRLLNLAS